MDNFFQLCIEHEVNVSWFYRKNDDCWVLRLRKDIFGCDRVYPTYEVKQMNVDLGTRLVAELYQFLRSTNKSERAKEED